MGLRSSRQRFAAGVERVFAEQISSVATRAQLDAALDFVRAGDVFVVTKIDRLARSVTDLCAIVKRIESKGATLRILAINLDTATPTGKLMLNVLASVAQFERGFSLYNLALALHHRQFTDVLNRHIQHD